MYRLLDDEQSIRRQISSNFLKFEISPQISSNLLKNVDFQEKLLKSPLIQKTENCIFAISLLNKTNNLSVKSVKHNCILGHRRSISLHCLVV